MPDSFGIGATINGLGVPILMLSLHIPPSLAVTGIYLALGTGIGSIWFPGKDALERALGSGELVPEAWVGAPNLDRRGRFKDARLLLHASREELAGRRRASSGYPYRLFDPMLSRRLSAPDLDRIAAASAEEIGRMVEASQLPPQQIRAMVEKIGAAGSPKAKLEVLTRFIERSQVRGLKAVMALLGDPPRALNAQSEIREHLTKTYGRDLADAVIESIAAKGTKPGILHPVAADITMDPRVAQELGAMVREPNSGVGLDHADRPVLLDRSQAPSVLVRLASVLPPEAGRDCALLIDGSNGDRLFFGERQGHHLDAVSSAISFAGTARMQSHTDAATQDFLHTKSIVWALQKTPLGLAGAQWGDVKEVHYLCDADANVPASAAFRSAKYQLFAPSAREQDSIPGFDELRQRAAAITQGANTPAPEMARAPVDLNWPSHGSLLLDAAVLRAAEAFVRNLGAQGRVEAGTMLIGGPGTALSEEEGLEICADLALLLSAISQTDSGQDAGGPFGTVVWNPRTGEATVGKNQVVPSRSAVNHGERVGLFLHPKDEKAWVVTSGEPCAMCYLSCAERGMDIAFVVTTQGVEQNTPFSEGEKNWAEFTGRAFGPQDYLDAQGKTTVQARPGLAARAALGEQILAAWSKNGENYAV